MSREAMRRGAKEANEESDRMAQARRIGEAVGTLAAAMNRCMTEEDVRRIVREELARDLEERRAKLRSFVAEVHGSDRGEPITDSRCEYLFWPPVAATSAATSTTASCPASGLADFYPREDSMRTCEDGCNGCDECTDYDDDDAEFGVCPRCHDDGRDPWNDYLLPCPVCQGEQQP